jgi:thiamine-phosphate pyrophosphorylase
MTAGLPGLPGLPGLLVLTDRAQLRHGCRLLRTLLECADAGLTHVVLRELDLSDDLRAALAADLAVAGLTVVSAHRPLAAAAGVHLPAAAPPPTDGRRRLGLVGRSCHAASQVGAAAAAGVDYVTLSPFAGTESKPGYGPPLPPEAYAGHPLPVYALGGITPANAAAAVGAGAHGVAAMGAVMRSADPAGVVAALLREVAG